MKKLLLTLVALLGLVINTHAFDFGISGSGTTQTQATRNTAFSAGVTLETATYKHVSVGVTQEIGVGSNLQGATELFTHYNLSYQLFSHEFAPFIGADARVVYGENLVAGYTAGPSVGAKLFLKKDVYVLGQVNYDFNLHNSPGSDGVLRYILGLGVRW